MDAVEDIKQRLSIEDVVGDYVQLKRAGRNFKGLSPFGAEKTPSFVVSPEKQIWHDFSSGRGGDMFSFVMEMEGLDFKQTLELLARKAGVDLEQYRSSDSSKAGRQKERALEALELACKFYQVQFSQNKIALEYAFTKRAFTKQTALDWRLGYSPNNGSAVIEFLKSKKFTEQEIKDAGLVGGRGGDMFRGRFMIPLCDPGGRVIGFTARLLTDNPPLASGAPKYINTPQTAVYDKSRHVFGLYHAKAAIRSHKYAVIAEGNLDVIMSHQAGAKQVVATAGTALTEFQLGALKRLTGDIRLSFDADKAGINATERAIPIASKVGVDLSVIMIPSGKDPDELIRQSSQTWQEIIERPQYALDWLIDRYARELDLGSARGKRQFSSIILQVVRELSNPVEREHYVAVVAERLGVSKSALTDAWRHEAVAKKLKTRKTSTGPTTTEQKDLQNFTITQNKLLAIILHQPKLREPIMATLNSSMFTVDSAQYLYEFLEANMDFAGKPEQAELLKEIGEYVKMLSLQFESLYDGLEFTELQYEAARLQAHLIEQYVKLQKAHISRELQTADDTKTEQLLQRARQLDSMLRPQPPTTHAQ
ncbi:MAG: DNA primase [Candidatus Saccharimonadales bacterium]